MLVEQTLFGKHDKTAIAIARIQQFAPIAEKIAGGYTVCVSGGKDSSVITELCLMAGVPCTFVHTHTSVDHPQTVYFVRQEADRLRSLGYTFTIEIPRTREGKQKTMWNLVAKYGFPTRIQRYCCKQLKEFVGKGNYIITGVRWAESVQRRRMRGVHEVLTDRMTEKIILNNDNDIQRKFTEICTGQQKYILNPIVDWSDEDVWEYITRRNIPVNPLYAQGYKRVGCIGCPLNRKSAQDLEKLPRYKAAYIRAGGRFLEKKKAEGKALTWGSAEEYYNWWKYELTTDEPSLFGENKKMKITTRNGEGGRSTQAAHVRLLSAVMEMEAEVCHKQLAKELGVSVSMVDHAVVVKHRASQELIQAIQEGEMSIHQVYRKVKSGRPVAMDTGLTKDEVTENLSKAKHGALSSVI